MPQSRTFRDPSMQPRYSSIQPGDSYSSSDSDSDSDRDIRLQQEEELQRLSQQHERNLEHLKQIYTPTKSGGTYPSSRRWDTGYEGHGQSVNRELGGDGRPRRDGRPPSGRRRTDRGFRDDERYEEVQIQIEGESPKTLHINPISLYKPMTLSQLNEYLGVELTIGEPYVADDMGTFEREYSIRGDSRGRGRQRSPGRGKPNSPRRSPGRRRPESSGRDRQRSPGRDRSESHGRSHERDRQRSPGRGRSNSHERSHGRSHERDRQRIPGRGRSNSHERSHGRDRLESPRRRRQESPEKDRQRSPGREQPTSAQSGSHFANQLRDDGPSRGERWKGG